jgi:hypothetical protein
VARATPLAGMRVAEPLPWSIGWFSHSKEKKGGGRATPKAIGGSSATPVWCRVAEPPSMTLGGSSITFKGHGGGSTTPKMAGLGWSKPL